MQSETNRVTELTAASFDRTISESKKPIVVDFWAPWCVYCKKLAPIYDKMAAKWGGQLVFATVNVDEQRALGERFGIMSLPTLKVFCGGREVGEAVGFVGEPMLDQGLKTMADHAQECLDNSTAVKHKHL